MNRIQANLLKVHKLGPLFSFVDAVEENSNALVLKCRNDLLAKILQEKFSREIYEVERELNIKVVFTYPERAKEVFKESFENFFYGKENEFTVAALRSVALGGGEVSSVFLVADAGMGKTHLLRATYNLLNFLGRKAMYITAGKIMEKLIRSYKRNEKPDFSNFRDADFLLIDDIHTLRKRNFALEFLARLMDRAASSGKVIIMASEMGPKMFTEPPSFRSRLMSSLVLRIHQYPASVRRKILRFRLHFHSISIPPEYERYAVAKIRNPRALLGVAVRVRAHYDVYGSLPDFSKFKELVGDLIEDDEDVFSLFRVRRKEDLYLAVYAMRLTGLSALEIADKMGKSRATVYNYIKRAKEILKKDRNKAEDFNAKLRRLRRDIL